MTQSIGSSTGAIGSHFDQICFVVEDLESAIEYWSEVNGVTRWSTSYDLAAGQVEKQYWGEAADFQFSCAYAFAGDVLIELARHDGGASVYGDWIEAGGQGPHHIGFLLEDAAEYAKAERRYLSAGLTKAMSGLYDAHGSTCRWAYFDTRAQIGCFTELYYIAGEAIEQQRRFRRGETDRLMP